MHFLVTLTAALTRWALRLALVLLVLVALAWAGLRWFIVPQIDLFRPRLEAAAAQLLGVDIRSGPLQAEAGGLGFAFAAQDVQVQVPGHAATFSAQRVRVVFSVGSLLRGQLRQLVIVAPEVRFRRTLEHTLKSAQRDAERTNIRASLLINWALSQPEIVLQGGRAAWAGAPGETAPLTLEQIDAVYRGGLQRRTLRFEATPDAAWGERFTLMARLRRPLLHYGPNAWRDWNGELYALAPRLALDRLAPFVAAAGPWKFNDVQGLAAARAWLELHDGEPVRATLDLALGGAQTRFPAAALPLALATLRTRVDWSGTPAGWQAATSGLEFSTDDGTRWPRGDLAFGETEGSHFGHAPAHEVRADHLDLALLARLAPRLPLPQAAQDELQRLQPAGEVESLQARWSGTLAEPTSWQTQGRVSALQLAAQPRPAAANGKPQPGLPGIAGAALTWNASERGGSATLAIAQGALEFPGVFDEPRIPLERLSAQIAWQHEHGHLRVTADPLELANADASGRFSLRWDSGEGADGSDPRFPGILDLQGTLTRADGARVYRYLPTEIPARARDYVHQAIQKGEVHDVAVKVQGVLHQFPFAAPGETGEFRIGGHVTDAVMAYVPRHLQPAGEPAWPALQNLAGDLLFQGASMQVRNASAQVAGHPGWAFSGIQADIKDLEHPRVQVSTTGQGALAAALDIVRTSPIGALAQHALDGASATGPAQLQLKLDLPIHTLPQSKVDGRVTLQNNDLRMASEAPLLEKAQGAVAFNEHGFTLDGTKAQFLGGTVQVTGGSTTPAKAGAAPVQIRAQGSATAEGLRRMSGWGPVPELAAHMSGETQYEARLDFRAGEPDLDVTSDLRGLAVALPAPFAKSAEASWPLSYRSDFEGSSAAPRQRIRLRLADLLALELDKPAHASAGSALRGALAIGAPLPEAPKLPAQGIAAQVHLAELNVDDWQSALQAPAGAAPEAAAGTAKPATAEPVLASALPSAWSIAIGQVQVAGRTLHDVQANGTRSGTTWASRVQARELAGDVAWTEGADGLPGSLRARLARLAIPASDSAAAKASEERVRELPGLDVQAEQFSYKDKPLGRLEIQAVNRAVAATPAQPSPPPEWQLQHLTLDMPDAQFSASGHWGAATAAGAAGGASGRRSVIDFNLKIEDSGKLLQRFGWAHVLDGGKGTLSGNLNWNGAPIAPHYASLNGGLHLDLGRGQFLKIDPGVGRLLSVLSLQAIPRRLTLDFRDIFSAGFAFDSVHGDVALKQGTASTENLQMKGPSAAVLINGSTNLDQETQNLRALVVPHFDAGAAALLATLINPAVGIGTFLAQLALKGPVAAAATHEFAITGTWGDPHVESVDASAAADSPAAHDSQPAAGNQP